MSVEIICGLEGVGAPTLQFTRRSTRLMMEEV